VLIPVIEALARENGVADRVEAVLGDARQVRLASTFDVVVSEMVGNEAFEEGLRPVLERARRRFLRPGGALIPEWVALVAAPVRPPAALGLTPRLLPTASIRSLLAHRRGASCPPRLVAVAPATSCCASTSTTRAPVRRFPLACFAFCRGDGRSVGGIAVWW
jgi:hypothetical protein